MSFQCLTLESSFPYNLIENVVTTFYASLLVNKQTFLDPSVSYSDDTFPSREITMFIRLYAYRWDLGFFYSLKTKKGRYSLSNILLEKVEVLLITLFLELL
ncbi:MULTISPECIES: hypothetical protein [unclassified Wolbachia]|uniref:hypothetical protein n=1 Tax=unclassified Wolbachia TaxID=2640676 RepID=UPI001BD21511|nr:hypothetical protein [Wolbachia endosymbiont of Ceratitis capitata]MDX5496573.1 hypothetical protein [Wolbachia endosymbiont of Nomada fabriciana]MDX5507983.1 hypothetical protein [Wolbachia endosymbiont of Hylaeus sinuatus]MDX5527920.1 hypothetical protein [Wolbachia endosymbiont of Andrena minutula]